MKKSDLKSGMVVEYRKGDKRLVVNNDLISDDGHYTLTAYNDDLKDKTSSNLDIIKVYRYIRSGNISQLLDDDNLELICERKEHELTSHEIDVLKALKTLGYEWLSRDFDRDLFAFGEKPEKGETTWFNYYHLNSYVDKDLFTFIKWEDEEPTNINDLLKEIEL